METSLWNDNYIQYTLASITVKIERECSTLREPVSMKKMNYSNITTRIIYLYRCTSIYLRFGYSWTLMFHIIISRHISVERVSCMKLAKSDRIVLTWRTLSAAGSEALLIALRSTHLSRCLYLLPHPAWSSTGTRNWWKYPFTHRRLPMSPWN